MEHLWGIDLGGTKIEGVILDPAALDRPICRLRVPTESEKGYDHIRTQIGQLLKMISSEKRLAVAETDRHGNAGGNRSALGQAQEFQHAMPERPAA